MRRIDKALQSVNNRHKQENYVGPLASTSAGGHNANVNNLYNSQVRDAKTVMPYGISSRPFSGVKAQTVVNDNSDNIVVGVYDPSRPKVSVGEICIYSSGGCSIYLTSTGEILIESGNTRIVVNGSNIQIDGSINISEDVEINGDANIGKNIEVGGSINVDKDIDINGNIEIGGNANIDGNVDVGGLSINGTSINSIIDTKISSAISRLN